MAKQQVLSNIHNNIHNITFEFFDTGAEWSIPASQITAFIAKGFVENLEPLCEEELEAPQNLAPKINGVYVSNICILLEKGALQSKNVTSGPTLLDQLTIQEDDDSNSICTIKINDGENDMFRVDVPNTLIGFPHSSTQKVVGAGGYYIILISSEGDEE